MSIIEFMFPDEWTGARDYCGPGNFDLLTGTFETAFTFNAGATAKLNEIAAKAGGDINHDKSSAGDWRVRLVFSHLAQMPEE